MLPMRLVTAVSSLVFMSACGGGGETINRTGDPVVSLQGANPGGLTPSYNSVDDEVEATDGVETFTYTRSTVDDVADISAYTGFEEFWTDFAAFGESRSGSSVYLINSTVTGYEGTIAFIERVGTTEIPTTGGATYEGTYLSVLTVDTSGDPVYIQNIEGTVDLTADFADLTISGTISERRSTRSAIFYADLDLGETSINGASFAGAVTGGGGTTPGFTTTASAGTYAGLLTGATADEALGSVTLGHVRDDGGEVQVEAGVFLAQ